MPKAELRLDLLLTGDALKGLMKYMRTNQYASPLSAAKDVFRCLNDFPTALDDALAASVAAIVGPEPERLQRRRMVADVVELLSRESPRGYALEGDVVDAMEAEGMDRREADSHLRALMKANAVYCRGGHGTVAPL